MRSTRDEGLGQRLRGALDEARAVWPDIQLDEAAFLCHVVRLASVNRGSTAHLRDLRVADVYLAYGCAVGHPRALEAFSQKLLPQVERSLARLKLRQDVLEEARERLIQKLLVGSEHGPPKIGTYAGRGSLTAWVRIWALHTAVRVRDAYWNQQAIEGEHAAQRLVETDFELEYLKSLDREHFRRAFARALSALSPRDRSVLAFYLVDGLNIEQIGTIYSAHRSTVARWIARSREQLQRQTRCMLARDLNLSEASLESVLRNLGSNPGISISRLLKAEQGQR